MKYAAYALLVLAAVLAFGGAINAAKPSVSPLVTVLGSFAFPVVLAWLGYVLLKRSRTPKRTE